MKTEFGSHSRIFRLFFGFALIPPLEILSELYSLRSVDDTLNMSGVGDLLASKDRVKPISLTVKEENAGNMSGIWKTTSRAVDKLAVYEWIDQADVLAFVFEAGVSDVTQSVPLLAGIAWVGR